MKHYEVTFIVDPVLSGDEIKATGNVYVEMLKNEGCSIVHIDELGLKQLAYVINKKSSGIYYIVEFTAETGEVINKLELALRRDERIMRFLTIALDKHGIKYNADKRSGLIGKVKKKVKGKKEDEAAPAKNSVPSKSPAPEAKDSESVPAVENSAE
jgi:small subunit ribosomal protein S6